MTGSSNRDLVVGSIGRMALGSGGGYARLLV